MTQYVIFIWWLLCIVVTELQYTEHLLIKVNKIYIWHTRRWKNCKQSRGHIKKIYQNVSFSDTWLRHRLLYRNMLEYVTCSLVLLKIYINPSNVKYKCSGDLKYVFLCCYKKSCYKYLHKNIRTMGSRWIDPNVYRDSINRS